MYLFYLTEVVVDVEASASTHQELDQFVDDGQLPLHNSYMESSVMNTKKHNTILQLKEKMFQKTTQFQMVCNWVTCFPDIVTH